MDQEDACSKQKNFCCRAESGCGSRPLQADLQKHMMTDMVPGGERPRRPSLGLCASRVERHEEESKDAPDGVKDEVSKDAPDGGKEEKGKEAPCWVKGEDAVDAPHVEDESWASWAWTWDAWDAPAATWSCYMSWTQNWNDRTTCRACGHEAITQPQSCHLWR